MLRVRIGLEKRGPLLRVNLKLVENSLGEFGDEEFPDAGVRQPSHLVCAPSQPLKSPTTLTPKPEAPKQRTRLLWFGLLCDVRAELLVDRFVAPFAKQMKIDVAKELCVFILGPRKSSKS